LVNCDRFQLDPDGAEGSIWPAGKVLNDLKLLQGRIHSQQIETGVGPLLQHKKGSYRRWIDALIETFTRLNVAASPATECSEVPVFVVACLSNTLTVRFRHHPDVYGAGELMKLRRVATPSNSGSRPKIWAMRWRRSTKDLSATLAEEHLNYLKGTGTVRRLRRIVDRCRHEIRLNCRPLSPLVPNKLLRGILYPI